MGEVRGQESEIIVQIRKSLAATTTGRSCCAASPHSHRAPSGLHVLPCASRPRDGGQSFLRELNHAVGPQKVVRRQAAGEARRRAGRQHMRRPGHVVAQRHGAERPDEHRAGIADSCSASLPDSSHAMCRCSVASVFANSAAFVAIVSPGSVRQTLRATAVPHRPARPRPSCLSNSAATACSVGSLHVIRTLEPGACSAWAIRSAAAKSAPRGFVGDHDNFARPRDRIDIHVAKHKFLRKCDEQIARPDDLIDFHERPVGKPIHTIGQRGDRLCAAHPIHFANAQLVARGQHVVVVRAVRRRRRNDGDLPHARRLCRHGRHQHRRRIRGRTTRHADPHALQRQVPLPQSAAVRAVRPRHRDAESPFETAGCFRECGESYPKTPAPPARGRRPDPQQVHAAIQPKAALRRASPCSGARHPAPARVRRHKSARRRLTAPAARQKPRSSSAGPLH